ncbi:MAG: hypothetical protein EZS28_020028, partial [Streblomastix strix]
RLWPAGLVQAMSEGGC